MTSASTRLVALLGHPVSHSRSPALMTAVFERIGIDATYVACDIDPSREGALRDAVRGLAALGAAGANVTLPHKRSVLAYVDEIDASAARVGAANVLAIRGGRVHAFNTDAPACVRALEHAMATVEGARVVVFGSGGAAQAVVSGAIDAGARSVIVAARDRRAALDVLTVAERAGRGSVARAVALDDVAALTAACANGDIIVQATSAGMSGSDAATVVGEAGLDAAPARCVAMELVYTPRETAWLAHARSRGLTCVDGLGMLAWQGAFALEHWFGARVSGDDLRALLDEPGGHG